MQPHAREALRRYAFRDLRNWLRDEAIGWVFVLAVGGDPTLDQHVAPAGHPERAARVQAALSGIDAAGLRDAVIELEPREATIQELARVHSAEYLEMLRHRAERGFHLDADTFLSSGSFETAKYAAGAVLAAVDALSEGRAEVGFVAARPPGHHASSARAMGFCLINNLAIAAAKLVARGERVTILDWDVHHGNGTQEIFWDEPNVLYVSTHQWPLYPGTGSIRETGGGAARGTTVNIPLPPGATGDVVMRAADEVIAPVVEKFRPSWVLVSAGYDAHRADPLANLALSAGDFADLASRARQLVPRSGRLLLVLEGGYDLDALRMSVGATLASLAGVGYRPERPTSGGPGADSVFEARKVHSIGEAG
jgi:acetoin utilization deacetylase AcuC-like enzyme